jgi:hypothetical protein
MEHAPTYIFQGHIKRYLKFFHSKSSLAVSDMVFRYYFLE